ncbi:MAG: hypothetical protein NVS3B28_21400 [Candidatus Velthaea sp.]
MTHMRDNAIVQTLDREPGDLAAAIRILGEPNRLKILYNMGLECRSVSSLIDATDLTQTNASFHLRALREAGLVRAERRGPFVYYCLADPDRLRMLNELKSWLSVHSASTQLS